MRPEDVRPLVTLRGRAVDLGLDAACVAEVALAREWTDVVPLDVAARLGWESAAEGEPRVLVVRTRLGDVPVAAPGKVDLRAAASASVLALPAAVLFGEAATLLSAAVIEDGQRPVLLLSPEGLCHLFQSSTTAPNTPEETS